MDQNRDERDWTTDRTDTLNTTKDYDRHDSPLGDGSDDEEKAAGAGVGAVGGAVAGAAIGGPIGAVAGGVIGAAGGAAVGDAAEDAADDRDDLTTDHTHTTDKPY